MTIGELDKLREYLNSLSHQELLKITLELIDISNEQELVMVGEDGSPRYFHTGELIDGKHI